MHTFKAQYQPRPKDCIFSVLSLHKAKKPNPPRGQYEIRQWERHRHPRVTGNCEQYLVFERNLLGMYDQEYALQPPLSLLYEIPESERWFFPHLSLDEVEAVPFLVCPHGKKTVLCYGTIDTVVEGHCFFCPHLKKSINVK